MKPGSFLKLVIAIIVSELAGLVGSLFTAPAISGWYATLAKPALNPPSWIFAPVWTTLYLLMGIAASLVWKKGLERRDVKIALGAFVGQLVLNALWSVIFFGLHDPLWAFIDLVAMWLVIIWTMALFYRISKASMWLLMPYILWVSFAAFLNYSIWALN